MHDVWILPASWWLRSALGGGLLLLAVWVLTWLTRQPARRQRLGECGVLAALLAAVLSAGPTWLRFHVPSPESTFAWLSASESAPPAAAPEPDDENTANALTWADPAPGLPPPTPDTSNQAATLLAAPAPAFSWPAARAVVGSSFSWDQLAFGLMTAYCLAALVITGRWLYGWVAL